MSRNRNLAKAVLAATVIAAAVAPARAFDALEKLLPAIPVTAHLSQQIIFQYVGFPGAAPARQIDELEKTGGLGQVGLDEFVLIALREPDGAKAVTGIDFSATRGWLVSGPPPSDVTAVLGRAAFAAGAPTTLEPRGFERSTVRGVSVWSKGDDAALDLRSRVLRDPFGQGLGRAQRIAILDDTIVATSVTSLLELTLAAVRSPRLCAICPTLGGALSVAKLAAGADAQLLAATGIGLGAIASDPELLAILESTDPKLVDRKVDELVRRRQSRQTIPAFRIAVMLATKTSRGGLAQLALVYGSETEARAGAETVAKRLSAAVIGRPTVGTASIGGARPAQKSVRIEIAERDGEWIGVVTLELDGPWTQAWKEYRTWQQLVLSRAFNVLDLFD